MERTLPVIEIKGTNFVVDVQYMCLFQQSSPFNIIPINKLDYMGTHYCFQYDLDRKALPLPQQIDLINVVTAYIPPLVELDPIGMILKYNMPLEQVLKCDDISFEMGNKDHTWLKQRLAGMLPTIDLAGDKYEVHLEINKLFALEVPGAKIDLGDFQRDDTGKYLLGYYNPEHRLVVTTLKYEGTIEDVLVPLKIPYPSALDAVGESRIRYNNDFTIIKNFGLSPKHQVATVTAHEEMQVLLGNGRHMQGVVKELNKEFGFDQNEKQAGKKDNRQQAYPKKNGQRIR